MRPWTYRVRTPCWNDQEKQESVRSDLSHRLTTYANTAAFAYIYHLLYITPASKQASPMDIARSLAVPTTACDMLARPCFLNSRAWDVASYDLFRPPDVLKQRRCEQVCVVMQADGPPQRSSDPSNRTYYAAGTRLASSIPRDCLFPSNSTIP